MWLRVWTSCHIGICLAVFAPAESQNLVNATLNNPFSHLRDISRSSKYIRYVIIDWLMTRKLGVNLLTVNLLTGGSSLTNYKPVVNRKRAGKSHNFDISMVQDYVFKVNGIRVQGNNLRLGLTMKNGREVSKGFSCNSLGKNDLEALAVQDYLNTDAKYWLASEFQCKSKDMVVRGLDFSLVKHLLSGTPEVKLRKIFFTLQCTSIHSIQQFKRFPLGLNTEVQVLKEIQNFVNSPGFSVWLTSAESCPGKWVQSQAFELSGHSLPKRSGIDYVMYPGVRC